MLLVDSVHRRAQTLTTRKHFYFHSSKCSGSRQSRHKMYFGCDGKLRSRFCRFNGLDDVLSRSREIRLVNDFLRTFRMHQDCRAILARANRINMLWTKEFVHAAMPSPQDDINSANDFCRQPTVFFFRIPQSSLRRSFRFHSVDLGDQTPRMRRVSAKMLIWQKEDFDFFALLSRRVSTFQCPFKNLLRI